MKKIQDLMKQAQKMQSGIADVQKKLENVEVEGQSGAGLVKTIFTCNGRLKSINIDSALMKEDEKDILEDLVVAAVNDGHAKVTQKTEEEMKKVAGGMNIPMDMMKGMF